MSCSLKPYSVVEFVSRGRKRKQRQVDVVPSKWIEFNKTRQKGTTKFLSAIDNEEDEQLLHQIVKNLCDPPEDWTSYSVIILGDAETYEAALEKIKRLEKEEHAFSLESGEELEDRQNKILEEVKRQKLEKETAALNDLLTSQTKEFEFDDAVDSPKSVQGSKNAFADDADLSDNDGSSSVSDVYKDILPVQVGSNGAPPKVKPTMKSYKNIIAATDKHKGQQSVVNLDLPVLNIPNVNSTAEFQTTLLTHLSMIIEEQQKINARLDNLEKYICDKQLVSTNSKETDFEEKYNFRLSIEDQTTFTTFNEELKTNKYLKRDVLTFLRTRIDNDFIITRSMSAMLKAFITKAVAVQYTAARKSSKDPRPIFKTCEFCSAMESVIITARSQKNLETTEKLLTKGLSDVLCNAVNWDRVRAKQT